MYILQHEIKSLFRNGYSLFQHTMPFSILCEINFTNIRAYQSHLLFHLIFRCGYWFREAKTFGKSYRSEILRLYRITSIGISSNKIYKHS